MDARILIKINHLQQLSKAHGHSHQINCIAYIDSKTYYTYMYNLLHLYPFLIGPLGEINSLC
jgi:hypothetical protein